MKTTKRKEEERKKNERERYNYISKEKTIN